MKSAVDSQQAQTIAVTALSYIAADPVLLPRFLALTGIEAGAIRQAAREPGFLAGVLQFVVAHEATLLGVSQATGIAPKALTTALRSLPTGDDSYLAST